MFGFKGFALKLLISGNLKFENGRILALGEPVCMVPIKYLYYSTKYAMEHHKNRNERVLEEMYLESWIAGYEITKKMVEFYKLKKFEERYSVAMDSISMFGFGDYKTLDFKRAKYAYFRVMKNPLALLFYPSKEKVDFFLAGANAGGGTIVHETIINCVELECAAVNGKVCHFVNANDEIFDKHIEEGKAYDMDWDYIRKKEREYINKDKKYSKIIN